MSGYKRWEYIPERHFIPASKRRDDFPFTYEMENVTDNEEYANIKSDNKVDFVIKIDESYNDEKLIDAVKRGTIPVFDFYKYLNKYSPDYIKNGTTPENVKFLIDVRVMKEVKENRWSKAKQEHVGDFRVIAKNFSSRYTFNLVPSIEELKELRDLTIKSQNGVTFDVETSGLDAEFDTIAGINFTYNDTEGYYIAMNHNEQFAQYNLPQDQVLDIIYEAIKKSPTTYMFNSRFDIRFLEFIDYDLDSSGTVIKNKKYDLSKVNIVDGQLTQYFADPDWYEHNMGFGEKHFLGIYRPDLKETLKVYNIDTFNTTLIDPTKLLFYAATDAIATLGIGKATEHHIKEFKAAGSLDTSITYPLMQMENRLIKVDTKYLEEQYRTIMKRLETIDKQIEESIGYPINMNSSKQKQELFMNFGLDTQEKTKAGAMSTSRPAIDAMIKRMDEAGETYPEFIKLIGEQSKLTTLSGTFFGPLLMQSGYRDGRIRLNYRHGSTSTGRFSSGKEEF